MKTYLNYLSWSEVVNWLQSSVLSPLERIWKKANFLHVGGCSGRLPLPVPVQKNFEGILASRNVWMPKGEGGDCLQLFVDNGGIWISNVNQQNHFEICLGECFAGNFEDLNF